MVAFVFLVATFALGIFLAYFFSPPKARYPRNAKVSHRLPPTTVRQYTRAEVSKHNTPEDLWVIIRQRDTGDYRVYDLSSYVDEHPGGDGILNQAGGDSTKGFYGPQHPPRAFDIVEDFCIGTLVDP